MKIDKRSEESVYITINGWVYYIDDSTGEQIMDKWETFSTLLMKKRDLGEGSVRESEPAFDVETRRAREEMEAGNEKTEYPSRALEWWKERRG